MKISEKFIYSFLRVIFIYFLYFFSNYSCKFPRKGSKEININNIEEKIKYVYDADLNKEIKMYLNSSNYIKKNLTKRKLNVLNSKLKSYLIEADKNLVNSFNKISKTNREILLKKYTNLKNEINESYIQISDLIKLNLDKKINLKRDLRILKNIITLPLVKRIKNNFNIIKEDEILQSLLNVSEKHLFDIKNIKAEEKDVIEERLDNLILLQLLKEHYDIIKNDELLEDKYDILKILKLSKINLDYDNISKLTSSQKYELRTLLKLSNNYKTVYNKDYKINFGYQSIEDTYRDDMEDAEVYAKSKDKKKIMFGVFDGHGGKKTSKNLKENLAPKLFKALEKLKIDDSGEWLYKINNIIKDTFLEYDENLCSKIKKSGSTAIISLIINNKIFLINLGDSRGLIIKNGKVIEEMKTHDHKPNDPKEKKRIEDAGGTVKYDGYCWRVDDVLAISRAFGDRRLKLDKNKKYNKVNPHVSPIPEIYGPIDLTKNKNDEYFIILACDGVWDVIDSEHEKNEEILKILKENKDKSEKEISDLIVNKAVIKRSKDNITAMVIKIKKR